MCGERPHPLPLVCVLPAIQLARVHELAVLLSQQNLALPRREALFALTREVSPPLREGAPFGAAGICLPELRSVIGPRQGLRLAASRRRYACLPAIGHTGRVRFSKFSMPDYSLNRFSG